MDKFGEWFTQELKNLVKETRNGTHGTITPQGEQLIEEINYYLINPSAYVRKTEQEEHSES